MSGFINNFGSLTTQNGQRLTFKDFDLNGDNKISEEEYKQVLKENKLDSVELSVVDTNGDKEISADEFAVLEQKQAMQEAVNNLQEDISIDFAGDKSKYLPELKEALKNLIEEFANGYQGAVSNMAEEFKADLPKKYEEIKSNILANDPSTISSNAVNDLIEILRRETIINSKGDVTGKYSESTLKALSTQIEATANSFIKSYTGNNLEADLNDYLYKWLNTSDADKLGSDLDKYYARVEKLGATIEASELASLKEMAKILINSALDKGIDVTLGNQKVTKSNLAGVLNKYTNGEDLKADLQTFIDNLSNLSKKEEILANESTKGNDDIEKAFSSTKGSEYQIDIKDLELPKEYYDNKTYTKKGKGSDYYKEEAREKINALKDQFKEQIATMLEAKGIPFERVEAIFENVYTMSTEEAVNDKVSGRHGTWLRKSKSEYNVKDLIDKFVEVFNKNIATEIDKNNASNTDFDTNDVDYIGLMTTDENGNADEITADALKTGETLEVWFHKGDYFDSKANKMIDRLKPTMLAKARNMCLANGIEFNQKSFETRFDSAKKIAVADSIDSGKKLLVFNCGTFNPQQLCTKFVTQFKEDYTAWVETEKAKK